MSKHPAFPATGSANAKGLQHFKVMLGAGLLLAALGNSAWAQAQMTLAWNASTAPNVKGYRLYQGGVSHTYTNVVDFENVTQATITNLLAGSKYFFAITAYNAYGLESPRSAELSYTAPVYVPPVVVPPTDPTPGLTNPSPVATLSAPWQTADVGQVGVAGSATDSNDVFTVTGAGTIGGSVDNFRFVYQPLSGDGEIRARIDASQRLAYDWAGVMIRANLTPGSAYSLMGLASGDIFRLSARTSTGVCAKNFSAWTATSPNTWVRLVRSGNTLYGYKSTDGLNWGKPVGHYNVPMASNVYIGLAVASGSTSGLNTAVFSDLTVVP